MNNEINIAEILKDCPKGTKLYSPLFGNITLEEVDTSITVPIKVIDSLNSYNCFTKTGLYYNVQMQNVSSSLPQKCATGLSSSSEETW